MNMPEGSSSGAGSGGHRCRVELKAYAKVDAKIPGKPSSCHPVLVRMKGPCGLARQRAAIDVVLVLHVQFRSTVPVNWHGLLNKATELVVENLGDNDRLAIVPALLKETKFIFDNAVIGPVKPKLLPMTSENKVAACNAVKSSEALRRNTPLLKDLESAESILYGRGSEDKKRACYIVVISNSNEDLTSVLTWRLPPVHAFGFRDAKNARTMYTIACSGDSSYGILDEGNLITQFFSASMHKITSTVEPVEVRIKCNEAVVLSEICAPRISYFISYDKKVGIIWANVRRTGATINYLIYLDIPEDYYDYANLLAIEGKFGQASDWVKGQQLVAVREGMDESMEVAVEIVRTEALSIVTEITEKAISGEEEKLHAAADKLRKLRNELQFSYGREVAESDLLSVLAEEIDEMLQRLLENNLWLEYMLTWRSHKGWPLPPLIINKKHAPSSEPRKETTNGHHSLLQLKILVKVDAIPVSIQKPRRGLPVLVHVMVPPVEEFEEKRCPIDLVAVLDVRNGGNVLNERTLNLIHKALEFVMEKLTDRDRLAILPDQPSVTQSASGLLHMTMEGRHECMKALSVLTTVSKNAQKTTHPREQLHKAICIPSTIMVSSSRTAAHERTKTSKLLNDAAKLLDERQAEGKERLGLIIVISNSDNISIFKKTLSSNYTVHAFSFSCVDNARDMYRIANCSSGIYGILEDHCDEISEAFKACISKITSTVVTDTEVKIVCSTNSSAKLSTIESGRFNSSIDHGKKTGSIFTGALYPGAERKFIVYVENVREDDYIHMSKVLAVSVTWKHGSNKVQEKLDGQIDVVRGRDSGSKELVDEIFRIQEVKIVSAITDPTTRTDVVFSKLHELHKRYVVLVGNVYEDLAGSVDEDTLARLLSDKGGSWLSYILSWLSFQELCEKPPSAPTPSRLRREMEENQFSGAPWHPLIW